MTPEEEKLLAESITLHTDARNAGARKMYDDRTGNKVAAANDARIQGIDNALAAPIDAQLKALESAPVPIAATPAAPAAPKPVPVADAWGSSTPTAWGQPIAKPSTPKPVTHPSGGAPVDPAPPAHKPAPVADGWGSSKPTAWGEPINKPATPKPDTHPTGAGSPTIHDGWGSSTPTAWGEPTAKPSTPTADKPPVATGFGTGGDVHPIHNPLSGGSATGHTNAPTASPPVPAGHSTSEGASTHTAAPASHSDGGAPVEGTASYSVVKGDTLSGIAAAHHMSLSEVESLNPQIKNPNLILPGETVHLSASMPTSSSYSGISSSGSGPAQMVPGVTDTSTSNKRGILGSLLGRFGKGGNTDGGVPPATDPAKTVAVDPTKSQKTEPTKPLS